LNYIDNDRIKQNVRVVVSWVVQVMADTCRHQDTDVLARQFLPQLAEVHEAIHHLTDAEAMSEVVKRIIAIVFLNAEL